MAGLNYYLDAALAYSEEHLALALADTRPPEGSPRPFLALQEALGRFDKPPREPQRIVGIKVEKRVIAIVLLDNGHAERAETRDLSSQPAVALRTTELFIQQCLPWFEDATVALELLPLRTAKRNEYRAAITKALRENGSSLWEVDRADLIRSFGDLPNAVLTQVRRVCATVWPALAGGIHSSSLLDAASMALYVHVRKRLAAASDAVWGYNHA